MGKDDRPGEPKGFAPAADMFLRVLTHSSGERSLSDPDNPPPGMCSDRNKKWEAERRIRRASESKANKDATGEDCD